MNIRLTLYDRSRVTTDWQCPRKRYLAYEYNGKGLASGNTSLELFMGTTLHDGLAAIATQQVAGHVDINAIANLAREQMLTALLQETTGVEEEYTFAHEQACLVEGLLRGFYKHTWPQLMHQYPRIVHIEGEMTYSHDGLTFMSRPDLVVADADGNLVYIEYKSTSSKKENWVNSWQTAVQLHSTIRAIRETTGEEVQRVIVQGLYKGYESYGKQTSPMCYAYRRQGNPPFSDSATRYDYAPGFKRYPVWELPGGVAAWVESMPEDILASQFPQCPPIFVNEELIDSFFTQRSFRENEIKIARDMLQNVDDQDVRDGVLNVAFPQRYDQCHPYFGKACQFVRICHGHVVDPIADGAFQYREPHHDLEVEQWKESDHAEPGSA